MRHAHAALLALALSAGCRSDSSNASPDWSNAAGGSENEVVASLFETAWENRLRYEPVFASRQSDPRYHGELADESPKGLRRRTRDTRDLLYLVEDLDTTALSDEDAANVAFLTDVLRDELDLIALGMNAWSVDPLAGPQSSLLSLAPDQPTTTARERAQLVARWEAMAPAIRTHAQNLRRGLGDGRVASRTAITKVIAQLDAILGTAPMDSPLVQPALGGGEWIGLRRGETVAAVANKYLGDSRRQRDLRIVNRHLQDGASLAVGTRILLPPVEDPLSPEERGRFLEDVLSTVEHEIYPALAFYRDMLETEILPNARPDTAPGLASLPGGGDAYRTLIKQHTSLDLSAEEIHEFGLAEVERIRSEMSVLGQRVFGTSDVPTIQARLRDDPEMHFTTREEVEAKAVEALDRARRAVPRWFGRLPEAECEVVRVPAHEEADTTIAYYQGPAPDGTRPGRYYINTYAPETRTRYEAEVLAYHEALPGHHLQIALAQELEDLPLILRHSGSTAFVEGWALYTERLCDEMGLYTGDVDRLGVLSFDAWRACRLVVDTGLHAFGWSRDRAIEFMTENTLLAENNVVNEVDRYIAWPGQALAYKLGQREILNLRAEAEEALGSRFDIAEFHDVVLGSGAVTLATLRRNVESWITAELGLPGA